MRKQKTLLLLCNLFCCILLPLSAQKPATNPVIYADAPDMSMLRVGDTYYMSSTTMHMSPGVPIMKSNDLVNWKLVNYAYDTLANIPTMNLDDGKNTYGRGSWASCLRYHEGVYYLSTFAQTTGKTYFYTTKNLEKGPWKCTEFSPAYHDHSFFFDEDGHIYMIYGNGKLFLAELKPDLSGVKPGTERVLIENASAPAGDNIMLGAEGSQLFKVKGKYYLFNITWPRGGVRTVIVHRADKITGPYEGRVVFQDRGIAQGGLVDTPDGRWFAYLFEDCGAVGRIPYLVPVEWKDGWPVLGVDGRAPAKLELPDSRGLIPGIVASDDFNRKKGERTLPLVWQWNHNPDNSLWSLSARKGYLRLTTGRVETSFTQAKNMLTQRTIGPVCTGSVSMDVSGMKEGDFAGLSLFQRKYGQVGVKVIDGKKYIVYHTRFDNGQEYHEPRVHQYFLNQDGWPCMLPYATDGETIAESGYGISEVAGTYYVIDQGTSISARIAQPVKLVLMENGNVYGENLEGTWSMENGTCYMTLTYGGKEYNGVFCQMKDEAGTDVMTFSAVGANESVWGVKYFE